MGKGYLGLSLPDLIYKNILEKCSCILCTRWLISPFSSLFTLQNQLNCSNVIIFYYDTCVYAFEYNICSIVIIQWSIGDIKDQRTQIYHLNRIYFHKSKAWILLSTYMKSCYKKQVNTNAIVQFHLNYSL